MMTAGLKLVIPNKNLLAADLGRSGDSRFYRGTNSFQD